MKRTLTVTRQTNELNVLYRPRMKERMFCVECDQSVRWVLPEEAMVLRRTSLRHVFRAIEGGYLHYVETADGFLLVCAESLGQESTTSGEIRDEIEKKLIAA